MSAVTFKKSGTGEVEELCVDEKQDAKLQFFRQARLFMSYDVRTTGFDATLHILLGEA